MATEISFNGFLSDQAKEMSKAIGESTSSFFSTWMRSMKKLTSTATSGGSARGHLKVLFAAALFHRALTAYQALILLTQKGFASEARATCRNILDAKFKQAYLFEEPEAAVLLIAIGEKKRADRLRDMKSGKLPVPEKLKGQDGMRSSRKRKNI